MSHWGRQFKDFVKKTCKGILTISEGVTEQLKSDDWLCWLQKINSIRSRAEEVVLHDLIYSL